MTQRKVKVRVCENIDSKLEYNKKLKQHPQATSHNIFFFNSKTEQPNQNLTTRELSFMFIAYLTYSSSYISPIFNVWRDYWWLGF